MTDEIKSDTQVVITIETQVKFTHHEVKFLRHMASELSKIWFVKVMKEIYRHLSVETCGHLYDHFKKEE